eukprot:CAMPEP_0198272664 /NCGR_PEP_ID=MMETSP1447-20131203/54052_1 /TAXON_ID=420782 /ORGANISM="Chaetoceros dichaeta, Strain CCMP1751" /LENGTH=426 /DNA_ID=CAMNT_0043965981 /DNA_START=106 /DNA_END=1386 /DNA_ORIENTATION=-
MAARSRLRKTTVVESPRRLELWLDTTTTTIAKGDEDEAFNCDDHRLIKNRARAAASTAVIIGSKKPIDTIFGSPPYLCPTILQRGGDNQLRRYPIAAGNSDTSIFGVIVDSSTSKGIDIGSSAMGCAEWVMTLPSSSSWNTIIAKNLVGAASGTGTKIAFSLQRIGGVTGLEEALELGIDALCLPMDADEEIWDAAVRATLERNERTDATSDESMGETVDPMTTPRVVSGICWRGGATSFRADRVCIDLLQTLLVTEGCWIGSSLKVMALVLSEACVSARIPSRSFRVNAGPVHSYVLMGDGITTRYLSELKAGEEVLVHNAQTGQSRSVAIGRLKTEVQPCIMVDLKVAGKSCTSHEGDEYLNNRGSDDGGNIMGQIFLQDTETVRLGQSKGSYVRVTNLHIPVALPDNSSRKTITGDDILLRII